MFPNVAEIVGRAFKAEIFPGVVEGLGSGVEIENGNVGAVAGFGSGEPDGGFVGGDDGVASGGVLVDADELGVC